MYKNLRTYARDESVYVHTPIPEVDIMRNGNKSRQLLSLARIAVLALCFTLVFAVALFGNSNMVANADYELNKSGAVSIGKAYQILPNGGATGSATAASSFSFIDESKRGWTATFNYSSVVPHIELGKDQQNNDTYDVAGNNLEVYKESGDTIIYASTGTANNWKWGVSNGTAASQVHGVINFDLSGFVAKMIQNDNVVVKAKISADIGAKEGTQSWGVNPYVNKLFYSAIGVPSGKSMSAELSYYLRENKNKDGLDKTGFVYSYAESDSKSSQNRTSNEITLTKETPNLSFALGCGWSLQNAGSEDHHVYMSNLKLTITVSPVESKDGAAPIVTSRYDGVATDGVNTYAPYIVNANDTSNQAKFPVYYDSIKNRLKLDSVQHGSGTLASYTNATLGNVPGLSGTGYYKFAQTEFVDTFNYTEYDSLETAAAAYGSDAPKFIGIGDKSANISSGGNLTWDDMSGVDSRVSGIATVKIGNTVFTISNASDINTAKEITVTEMVDDVEKSVSVGYAIVQKTNSARVVVSVYFTTNCTLETVVTDNGNKAVTTTLTVSGIDTTAPSDSNNSGTNIFLENYVGTDGLTVSALNWFRQNTITTDANFEIKEDESAAGYSPYIWFYTVDKADSISALKNKREFATYADVKSAGILPIAAGELTSFTYDFVRGAALTVDGKTYQGNPSDMDVATGHGYYRFTFYMFDLAGNKGGEKSFFMKVDYDKPEYTLDFKYDKDGTTETIEASQNGKWATGNVTLKFTVKAGGFSGFTFRFEDSSGTMHAFVINGAGEYAGETYSPTLLRYMTAKATSSVENNTHTININGQNITVTYGQVDGKSTFTFSIPKPQTGQVFYEWVSEFSAFEGQYASLNAIDSDDNSIEYVDVNWSGGVKVLIDVEAPIMPGFSDEEGFISEFGTNGYEIPQSRTWYTSSFTLEALLGFSDAILSTEYAKGLKIHYGISVVKNSHALDAIRDLDIANNYKTATDPKTQFGFLRYIVKNGEELDSGGSTDFTTDLLAAQNAGMRVIHIWAEDQAGNLSAVNKLYVLVDTTSYTVSASVKSNVKLESGFASISVTDEEDTPISTIKRGEKIKFNISLANSYVPFKFVQNGNLLLENYDNNRGWTKPSANANGNLISFDTFGSDGASSITLTFDDVANLSDLLNDSNRASHAFELSARKTVTYSLTNTKVAYTAEPTDVAKWMSFGYEPSKNSFKYDFVEGENVVGTPTIVGDYKVRIYIPKEDESFVTDDFAMDEAGKQVFETKDYSIVRGKVVITATAVSATYGDKVPTAFDYNVEGIAKDKMSGEGIFVDLYISGKLNSHGIYDVGAYQILNNVKYTSQDAQGKPVSTVDNYDVTFVSGEYSVSRRRVTVDAWQASKKYGNSDPEFRFGVALSQFAGLYAQESDILDEIFEGYRKDSETTADGYAIYFADGRINRKSGNDVGVYAFEAEANLFDVNKNYTVLVQTSKYFFEIEKRSVKLDVSGQSSVFKYDTPINDALLATILPTYKISASDMAVASNIEALFENGLKIKLGAGAQVTTEIGYSATYKYAIILDGTLTDGNIEIELDTGKGTDYIIYITEQNAVVIKVKDGVKFEFTFGYRWNENSIKYDKDKFDVEGNVPTFDSVVWTMSITTGTLLDAGRYIVNFTGVKLYDGETELSDAVFVEPVSVTINPAKVVVNPTASTMSKVYGDKDDCYDIGFEIATVDGQTIGTDGNYAGIAYDDIFAAIKGAYVRAVFDNAGQRLSFANRYDDATDSSNVIYGTDGRYYSFAVGTEFYSDNANFSVEASLDPSARFSIEQKTIDLNTKHFVGLSKTQDGNADVPYASKNVTMYDLTYLKVLTTDEVNLSATASYDGTEVRPSPITFTNLSLTGDKAHNYKLGQIVNGGKDTVLNNSQGDSTPVDIDENTFVKIVWIDNENGGEVIRILAGKIALLKSDVTISKQYDNTKNLTISNVSIASGNTTDMLNSAEKFLIEEESSAFGGVNVGDNYTVTVTIFYVGMQDYVVDQEGEYDEDDVVIVKNASYNGKSGIKITIKNVKSQITKRLIDKDSFDSLDAVDRDYNATDNVDMTYSFAQGALAEGDTAQTVGLQLKGLSAGKDAGTYSVTVDKNATRVLDNNYAVDADSINNAYKNINVVISRARLVPDVTFKQRVYSGSSELNSSDWTAKTNASGKGVFTFMQYADNLASELALFSYDLSKVSFTLSKEGKADANVQANGKHNVMVTGLEILFNGTEEQKQKALKNYKLEGSVYSATDKKYNEFVNLTFGEIAEFEIIDALDMSKKQIQLKVNDFVVNDKVYDGTTDVNVVINITDGRLIAQHADLLEVVAAGAFARKQAGDSIAIMLSAAKLQAKGTLSDDELATALEAIANYELLQYKGTITGNIKARPLLVNAYLGEREYNGDESAIKSDIEYTFTNMIAGDEKYYNIQTRNNAYFDDRFVNVKRDEEGNPIKENGQYNVLNKQGTAYNLRLTTIKEKYTNYTLVYSSKELLAGKTVLAYVADGIVSYGAPAVGIEADEYWYALDTTKYYVAATDENRTTFAGHIVGFYKHNGADVLMLERTYGEANYVSNEAANGIKSFGETADEINYLHGEGKITQRSVYIRANGIEKNSTAKAFEKYYDGTDKFFGVGKHEVGEGNDFDYQYTAGAVANVILGDDVTIADVSAKFDSAYANAKYVVFTASGITGKDAYNYTIEGKTVSTVNLEGRIKQRIINAHLADEVAEYGIATGNHTGNVTYKFVGNDGNEYDLVNEYANESAFYMTLADYLAAVGLESADATLFANNTYSLDNGRFVKAAEGAIGEYIRLGGTENDRISALPQAYVSFASTKPDAGSVSKSYRLSTAGNAKNFKFNPVYSDVENGTSKVEVVKKDLYVVTVSNGYTANYGQFIDKNGKLLVNVEFLYLDKNGKDGIVSGQTQLTLFKQGNVNYYPVAQLGVYNSETGEVTTATAMSKTSDKLGANEYYVFYLVAPDGVDYNEVVKNYNVILAGKDSVKHKLVDVDGVQVVRTVFDMSEQGATVKPETATLQIVLPKLTGVSVGSDTENSFTYTYSIDNDGNGINRLHDVVQGELSTDEVIFVDDNGNELYPVNYKETPYSGTVYVRRYINADGSFVARKDKDANGYYIEWNSGEVKKEIKIEKAEVGLRARNVSEYYNGKAHAYVNDNNRADRISYNMLTGGKTTTLTDDDYEIHYQVFDGKNYVDVSQNDIVDAGKYRVTVKLTDNFLTGTIGSNYKQSTSIAEFQVLRAIVEVELKQGNFAQSEEYVDGSTVLKLTGEYVEGKKYSIDYTVKMNAASNDPEIAIEKGDTKLVGLENISSAGKYSFAVVISGDYDANNYVFLTSTGVLELTTKNLSTAGGSSITFNDGKGVVANRLEVKEIKTENALASDMSYLKAVEQYVAAMSRKAGVEDARVAAVLRVNLYLDESLVAYTGSNTTITVELPQSVKNLDGMAVYYVNSNGGLTRLTDYTVEDGKLTYTTDYINGIVFVDVNPQGLEAWKIYVIVGACALFALVVIATVVTIAVKKAKLKKIA